MQATMDVLVVGGGPAGTATALSLARSGHSVTVLERGHYTGPRVGEMLPPAGRILLQQLGVWERFQEQRHTVTPGIVSVWAEAEPYNQDFIFNPYGTGWNLDRTRFDHMLAEAAQEAGAELLLDTRVTCCRPDGKGWLVEYRQNGEAFRLRASFLVEATGRASPPSGNRRPGGGKPARIMLDQLVGVVCWMPAPTVTPDQRVLIEATPSGWWYSAMLPGNQLVAVYMTDADLLPRRPQDLRSTWAECLTETVYTQARVAASPAGMPLRVISASSYLRPNCVGSTCLGVGDTASAFDPLSAQGISKALDSGLRAAEAIRNCLRKPETDLEDYAHWIRDSFLTYLRGRAEYYGQVRRWPRSPFWQRRQVDPLAVMGQLLQL